MTMILSSDLKENCDARYLPLLAWSENTKAWENAPYVSISVKQIVEASEQSGLEKDGLDSET